MDSRAQREKKRIIESTKLKNKRKEPASGRGKGIPGFLKENEQLQTKKTEN